MERHADEDEDQRVERDGNDGKPEAGAGDRNAADDRRQRRGTTRRMQRARQRHGEDRKGHRKPDGKCRIGNERGDGHAGKGGDRVAADNRPGLGQRAGGHGEEQHGGCADGRNDQRQMGAVAHRHAADETGHADTQKRAEAADQPFLQRGAGQNRREKPDFGQNARLMGTVMGCGHDDPDL